MQKVITVEVHQKNATENANDFNEIEFPILNQYLKDGWEILKEIPIMRPASASVGSSNDYSIVFILSKPR